jgi:hypothetical protein
MKDDPVRRALWSVAVTDDFCAVEIYRRLLGPPTVQDNLKAEAGHHGVLGNSKDVTNDLQTAVEDRFDGRAAVLDNLKSAGE